MSQARVVGWLAASFPMAYVMFRGVEHVTGNPVPETSLPQWQAKTRLLNLSKEMEGCEEPVLLNPFRTGVPATVRSKADLPQLEDDETGDVEEESGGGDDEEGGDAEEAGGGDEEAGGDDEKKDE